MSAAVYIGTPKALQAEIGLPPCYAGRYVVAAFRANGDEFTPECLDTKADAQLVARDLKAYIETLGEAAFISWVA